MTDQRHSDVGPVRDRIDALDILRGFALLGIYVSIVHSYNGSLFFPGAGDAPSSALDGVVGRLQSLFINKRFIGLLSFLFGLGIAIQQRNFADKGVPFGPYFVRRMFVLAGLGLINTTFFFSGEILLVYAVFGLVTLALSRAPRSVLFIVAGFAYFVWGQFFEYAFREDLIRAFSWFPERHSFAELREIRVNGPWFAAAALRWIEYGAIYTDNNFHMGMSLAMILCGYAMGVGNGHVRFLSDPKRCHGAFLAALAYTAAFALFAFAKGQTDFIFMYNPVATVFYLVFLVSSMFVYAYPLARLRAGERERPNAAFRCLARNGRLALTGYMGAAFVYALIFYRPGLGLFMEYGAAGQTLIALAVYAAFSAFAAAWLARFQRGPVEWIFRRLSYGKLWSGGRDEAKAVSKSRDPRDISTAAD